MLRGFRVASLDGAAIEAAYASELPDFEDALQLAAAAEVQADAIVTRNKRHFRQRQIAVFDPEELRIDMDPETKKRGRSAFIRSAVELYLSG